MHSCTYDSPSVHDPIRNTSSFFCTLLRSAAICHMFTFTNSHLANHDSVLRTEHIISQGLTTAASLRLKGSIDQSGSRQTSTRHFYRVISLIGFKW